MEFPGSNQYSLEEVFASPVAEAFEHLQRIGTLYPLSPYTASMESLTGNKFGVGSKWREHRRHLFLRDIMECEVVECHAPSSFSIVTNDGEHGHMLLRIVRRHAQNYLRSLHPQSYNACILAVLMPLSHHLWLGWV